MCLDVRPRETDLLARRDLGRRHVEGETAIDVTDNDGNGHKHHGCGYTAEDEAEKPKTCAVGRHSTPLDMSSCMIRRGNLPKGSHCPCKFVRRRTAPPKKQVGGIDAPPLVLEVSPAWQSPEIARRSRRATAWRKRRRPRRPGAGRWRWPARPGRSWCCGRCGRPAHPPARQN